MVASSEESVGKSDAGSRGPAKSDIALMVLAGLHRGPPSDTLDEKPGCNRTTARPARGHPASTTGGRSAMACKHRKALPSITLDQPVDVRSRGLFDMFEGLRFGGEAMLAPKVKQAFEAVRI